jgi:hypothetical protein
MTAFDTELTLPAHQGGTRCRVQVYPASAGSIPVVILIELDDNPGLPISASVCALAALVREQYLVDGLEPLWVEEWRGRGLIGIVRGRCDLTTFMSVDPHTPHTTRRPVDPGFILRLRAR